MTKSRRSISPQTRNSPGPATKKAKTNFGLSRILDFFKPNASGPSQHPGTTGTGNQSTGANDDGVQFSPDSPKITSELDIADSTPLANEYSSSKKKRLSVQGHLSKSSDHVPRSSLIPNTSGFYQSYYDNLQTEREELSNDLERRMSTVYDDAVMKDGVGSDISFSPTGNTNPVLSHLVHANIPISRDGSPSLGSVRQNSGVPTSNSLVPYDQTSRKNFGERVDSPIMVEHELAPLYKDAGGNLARPPFINLDPRERYHLLRLKKSIETSRSLKRSLKYMINPNETVSKQIASNKVDTSTQTHDMSYVSNKLNFYNTKKKLTEARKYRVSKKPQTSRGFHSGEFFYDIKKIQKQSEKRKHQLDGYLGSINKPIFNEKKTSGTRKHVSELEQGNDEDLPVNRLASSQHKSTDDRVGLNETLKTNQRPILTLDDEYITQSGKLSNRIKVKDSATDANEAKGSAKLGQQKERVLPSSGFDFQVNKNEMEAILSKHEERKEAPATGIVKNAQDPTAQDHKSSSTSKSPGFAASEKAPLSHSNASTPLFGLNNNKGNNHTTGLNLTSKAPESQNKRSRDSDDEGQPASLPKLSEKPKPNSSFEQSSDNGPTKKPLFSFGPSSSNDNAPVKKPLFSFGATKAKEDDGFEKTNPESKGSQQGESSVFPQAKDSNKKPLFSFSQSGDAAKPVFGGSNQASADTNKDSNSTSTETQQPSSLFSGATSGSKVDSKGPSFFGTESKSSVPLFGQSEKTQNSSSTIGAKPMFASNSDDKTKPPLFGSTTTKDDTSSKPAFSFPSLPAKSGESEAKPGFFGSSADKSSSQKPAFSFGEVPDTTKNNKESEGGSVSRESSAQPAFNLGSQTPKPEAEKKPLFSFGNTSAPTFGSSSQPEKPSQGNETAKPIFAFGQKETTPAFGTSSSTPANRSNAGTPSLFGGAPRPAFANTSATPAFGRPASSTAGTFNASGPQVPSKSNFEFNFGATSLPSLGAPQAAASSAPAFSFGGTSASSTPAAPALGGANQIAAPQPSFGGFGQQQQQPQQQPQQIQPQAFKFGQTATAPPAFSFGGASRGNTPDQQGPGMFGQQQTAPAFGLNPHAGTPTPPMFGGGMGMNAMQQAPANNMGQMNAMGGPQQQQQQQPYTPPSIANRKILPIRQRRR